MAQERRAIADRVSALHAHPNELRDGAEMLCMPLGAGSAHVMLLRPVGVEQSPNEVVKEIAEVGKHARRLVAGGPRPVLCSHDPLRRCSIRFRLLPLQFAQAAPCCIAIIGPNLLKRSRNSPAISICRRPWPKSYGLG